MSDERPSAEHTDLGGESLSVGGHGFGTAPVFLAGISTILGAVLFLRFGYAVAHTGLLGAVLIILIGHAVTVPTALAIAEIATNRRVEGGGEYFIISRSFGTTIGATIGIALYLSQAVSIAFYTIAFAEAFRPWAGWVEQVIGRGFDPRMVSLPFVVGLIILMIFRGAAIGVKALWVVASVLAASLAMFFSGPGLDGAGGGEFHLLSKVADADPFFLVFAIAFPAFTGMTAGVGLSGDLKNPRRSIPFGTLAATAVGFLVYLAVVVKLSLSASPEQLGSDQLIMARIAVWGPIIPIGLACASVSSAIGSVLVAPRTLQALAADRVFPSPAIGRLLSRGAGKANEPRNATVLTGIIAVVFVAAGNVDFVARIISMFFMVTYGSLCAISFLEHFAARPSYRPTFRSRWYISLTGAVVCVLLMFQMDLVYATLALLAMTATYLGIKSVRGASEDDLGAIFKAAMIQATRHMQIRLQDGERRESSEQWRPSIIMVDGRTFERSAPLQMMNWLCARHAVGTYLHFIKAMLDSQSFADSKNVMADLVKLAHSRHSSVYVDTIVSPSMRSALAQSLQVPGISGMENNTVMFQFSVHDPPEVLDEVLDGCRLTGATDMDMLVLRAGDQFFGSRKRIDIWLTWHDYDNAALMILLCYMLVGHADWREAEIRILAAVPEELAAEDTARLEEMVASGRIPISPRNLTVFPTDADANYRGLVREWSSSADLVVLGFTLERLADKGAELFQRHKTLGDVLFVCSQHDTKIE